MLSTVQVKCLRISETIAMVFVLIIIIIAVTLSSIDEFRLVLIVSICNILISVLISWQVTTLMSPQCKQNPANVEISD